MLAPIITNNITQIKAICKEHKVKELYVFGSAARNEMKEDSDVDFSVDFEEINEKDFANNYFSLMEKFQKLFKRNVDFVTEKFLVNKYFINDLNKNKVKLI